jgi:nucleoside-diphosphate-sugar epimerase
MKVLITGSSGFIGSAVVNDLKRQGMTSFGVDLAAPRAGSKPDVFHRVDMCDATGLRNVIKAAGVQAVIHLAATHDLTDMSNERIGLTAYHTNTDGTKNLLDALSEMRGIKRVIFTSTQLISNIGHQVATLDEARPDTFYGRSKLIGERMIHAYEKKPYSWVIVRPTTVWGPGMMTHYRRFIGYIEKGWYFHITDRPLYKSYGYIDNVAHEYVSLLLAQNEDVNRKTFYLADYDPMSLRDYANELGNCLGARPIRTLPLGLCKFMAVLGDLLARAGLQRFPYTSFRVKNILNEYVYQLGETRRVCGPLPVNFREGVIQTVKWYRNSRKNRGDEDSGQLPLG